MIGQDKQEQQEHSDFQEHCENSRKKYQTSNRILKHHDLDRLLVYGKRNINPTQSNQQYTEKNSIKTPKKFVEALKSKRNSKNIKNYKNKNISLKFTQQNQLIQNKNIQNNLKQIQKQAQPIEQGKLEHDKTKQQISSKNNEIDQNLNLSSINIKQQKKRNLLKLHKKNSYLRKSITALSESQSDDNGYKFPFMNYYLDKHSDQYLSTMEAIDEVKENINSQTGTFINCDVRYFNWSMFIESTGKFDVMIIDPPWRIKGAQQNDSQFMFSNCKFSLEYNTMANSQISRIPLHMVIEEGFIFLWILNSQLNSSLQIMQNWGFELIDELVWVKLRDQKVYLTHGYYFMHSYEICLIGYKSNHKKPARLKKYISNNTIFAEVQKKSQKPSDLYYIIEMIFKGKKKIEIFARNNNLRFGLFSLGNQLGQSYDKWKVSTQCDHCEKVINFGHKRYKSKHEANYDVCQSCADNLQKQYFFELFNQVDQDIRHQYVLCNGCKAQPIWGIRFQCITCYDFDLCQLCFDRNLSTQTIDKFHPVEHEYRTIEVPVFGNGFNIHQYKCASCYTNPITGICYNCLTCKNYKLCQKCFFQKSKAQLAQGSRSHKQNHQIQAIFEPQLLKSKKYQCFQCKKQILEHCWMCQNCYNFFFCQQCYNERQNFKSFYANSHKKYHIYTHIF